MSSIGISVLRSGGLGVVVVGLSASFLVHCGKSVLRKPISASAGAWNIDITYFMDGPNSYGTMSQQWEAGEGMRFLWINVTLTNTSPQKRRYNWDRCDLDQGGDAYLPGFVLEKGFPTDTVEIVDPGQQLERTVVFSFPEAVWPTRMKCGDVVLPLEAALEKEKANAKARKTD